MPDDDTSFAGDVVAEAAWRLLNDNPRAVLVDVRTNAEWAYVGVPDLGELGRKPVFIEWQRFPSREVDGNFVSALAERLEAIGVRRDDPVLFICRSGQRSRSAAVAMAAAGYSACFNIADGFEGPLDLEGHRGGAGGWKAAGLPWTQT
jgi:rhodanese-related sulfurtransferase